METMFKTLAVIFTVAILASGCAHTPCRPAKEVMQDKGIVLECRRNSQKYQGEVVTECLIVPADGWKSDGTNYTYKTKWITVFRRHCGQY